MGLFDGTGDNSGLMGMYANPQMAGLLGMSQGLLSAAGPSRIPVSMGQALGAGLGGMQQGAQQGLGLGMQMIQYRNMMNAMNAYNGQGQQPASQPQPAPQVAPSAPVTGDANTAGMSGLMGGMGVGAPLPSAAAASASGAYPAANASSGPLIQGRSPAQLYNMGVMFTMGGNPSLGTEMMKEAVQYDPTLAAQMPTDITKMGMQGGMTAQQIQAANAAGVAKANAPVSLRSPILWDPTTGKASAVPSDVLQAGYGAQYGAQEGAKAANQNQQVWDPTANNGVGGMVFRTTAQVNAATSGAPGGTSSPGGSPNLSTIFAQQESNGGKTAPGNPMQIQQGTFNQYAQPGESWNSPNDRTAVANRVLSTYQQKYGGDLGRIATAYFSGEGNVAPAGSATPFVRNVSDSNGKSVASYVGDIYGRAGSGAPAQQGNPMAAAPPLGVTNAANASQTAPSKQMADAYGSLSTADANYQQSREALTSMINLANNKGAVGSVVGVLPESVGTKISPDAAEYQKLHATYVAMQGKALGSGGTDMSRSTINESVPTYDKPQTAMVSGLTTQLNNLDLSHIKTQFLTPLYQQGNEKAYTQQSAAFDQNVKPSMIPVLTQSGDAQRAAVQAAIKANPALRSNFEWAFNNGLLK